MIQNKLIRAKNGNENTSNFTTYLDPPIILSENSSIALQSFNMELTPNVIDITGETQTFAYATVKESAGAYANLIKEHTFTIPINTYTLNNLAYNLTVEANKQLFYETSNNHSREQGSEIIFYYDQPTEKISFIYAGRLASEFCGTPVDKMAQTDSTGNVYEYTLDGNDAGNIKRLTADETTFDFYEYSTVPFCRGSAQLEVDVTQSVTNYVIGLINPLHLLSNPNSDTILQKIKYGVMLLDNTSTYDTNDFPQDKILIKVEEDGAWEEKAETTANSITFTLGRVTGRAQGYQLYFGIDNILYNTDYEYGNYVLICATYTEDNILTYKICETKLGASSTTQKGYYDEVNPDYINLSNNNFINLDNTKYNDENVGFIPNQSSYITLNLFNKETMQLFGFETVTIESSDIYSATNNVINITPKDKINARYQFPDSLKLVIDLPLDCYDDGKNQNILCFIPNNISGQFITYQPSPALFITLKNNKSLYLDHIAFKLYDNENILLPNQIASSAVVIIQSIK